VGQRQNDHPGLVDGIVFKHVERVHRRDADAVGFMGKREGGCLFGK
jgi:hypothetical protein